MKLVFLSSSKADLRWFKRCYISIFSEGKTKADKQFLLFQKALKVNPYIGYSPDIAKDAREYSVLRTPFSFIYLAARSAALSLMSKANASVLMRFSLKLSFFLLTTLKRE